MQSAALLVLENSEGKVVRTFSLDSGTAHIIQRQDTRRLELVPSLDLLKKQNIKYKELGLIEKAKLAHLDFAVAGGKIRLAQADQSVVKDLQMQSKDKDAYMSFLLTVLLMLSFIGLVTALAPMANVKLEQELKQQVVQIAKKIPVKQVQPVANTTTPETVQKAKTNPSLKRMGALAVLGSLKSSNQKGGLNLHAVQTTAGPGLGGTGGSGGVQTNIYAKGLVGAPLGAGANIEGGGGTGTKGKGGGQAGYGTMSLVGSKGASPIPLGSEAVVGGGLDKDLIAAVINKNLGQIRFCYEQGLQGDPNLAGRVAVGFVIGGAGMVKAANVENTSLNSKMVEDCILLRLKSWKFPLPEGGADVKVSYPFVLRRAGGQG